MSAPTVGDPCTVLMMSVSLAVQAFRSLPSSSTTMNAVEARGTWGGLRAPPS